MHCTTRAATLALGVALLAPPAPAQIAVTSNAVAQHVATLGDRYDGTLVIRNTSAEPQTTRVLQTDYAFTADGRATFAGAGTSARSNAGWIAVDARQLVIPARTTATVHYTVTVPDTGALHGTYWSLLIVEHVGAAAPPGTARLDGARGDIELTVVTRYATQVATHVGTAAAARIEVDSVHGERYANGHCGVRFDFANFGERASGVALTAEIYDDGGARVGRLTQARGLLYPGSSARQEFDFGALASGEYRVIISADPGGETVFGGSYRVRF